MTESKDPVDWYDGLRDLRNGNRRALHGLLAVLPEMPDSFLDIGCGDGSLVEIMSRLVGISEVMGIDQYHGSPLIHPADLRNPVELGRRFELVTCWEVGEHIAPAAADTLCATVTRHVGQWLVFTAAQPGQAGYQHVNCQPLEYWREKFIGSGLMYAGGLTKMVRNVWEQIAAFDWLRNNVQVFERPR